MDASEATTQDAEDGERYQITIVKYGTRTTSRSDVYLNYHLYHEPDGPIGMDYFFWVLRSPRRTLVVDTGFSEHGGRSRGRTQLAEVPALLRAFGVEPSAGPTVILTHAHYDHAGNLDLFASSPVVMAERERSFWSGGCAGRALFHHSVDDEDLACVERVAEEGRLRPFSGSLTVAPGVEVIEVGGHTPGQCMVKVRTSEGTVLLTSDAVHYYEELERDWLFTSVANLVEMYESFDRIRTMLETGEVDVLVSGHDPDTLSRFTPVVGPHAGLAATIGRLDG